jgi:Protein of unknown function (DUF2846)
MGFSVSLDTSKKATVLPDTGKATVYFIQDDGPYGRGQHYTVRVGVDGRWVGAYKQNSYFALSVEPGEHHICADVQTKAGKRPLPMFAHLNAVAGEAYYFRTQLPSGIPSLYPEPPYLYLDPLDSDEGKYLITAYPYSNSALKK